MKLADFLGHAEIRVHLSEGALIACEVQRTWRKPSVTRKARFEFVPGERADALNALADWIATAPARRSIVWIIGTTEAQYFMLPWSPAWMGRATRDAYARAHYEQLFERDASQSAFCFAAQDGDNGQLVSCISLELQTELAAHAAQARCELAGIKPSIPAVWERFRDVLEGEQGTLCVVDGDREAIVRHNRKRIEEIVIKPCSKATAAVATSREGVVRKFSNVSGWTFAPKSAADLELPTQEGFVARRDSAYAFALCGAL
ncbi:MAG: hypothetical protein ABWX83_13060 [Luteibacter sp.]